MHDDAIRATFDEFADAWNRHDVAAMAACWVADGSVVHPYGHFAARREGIEELLANEHRDTMRDSTYRITKLEVKPSSDTTVIAECDGFIDTVRAPNGRPYQIAHTVHAVLVRDGARWRFLAMHPSYAHA